MDPAANVGDVQSGIADEGAEFGSKESLHVNVIYVNEVDVPKGTAPVEWILFTTASQRPAGWGLALGAR